MYRLIIIATLFIASVLGHLTMWQFLFWALFTWTIVPIVLWIGTYMALMSLTKKDFTIERKWKL